MCFYIEEFTTEGIDYDKIKKTIFEYSYSLAGLSRKIKEPVYKVRRAICKEEKHNAMNDLIIYAKIAMLFNLQIENLIY